MQDNTYSSQSSGAVSEWNEGNLKNLRLHEAQEIINFSKMFPLTKTGGKYNYELWIHGVNVLYGEGKAKYSDKEVLEVERIKNVLEEKLIINPPIRFIKNHKLNNQNDEAQVEVKIDQDNYLKLKKLIEIFESFVKSFNDAHGLSTRNVEEEWEGL